MACRVRVCCTINWPCRTMWSYDMYACRPYRRSRAHRNGFVFVVRRSSFGVKTKHHSCAACLRTHRHAHVRRTTAAHTHTHAYTYTKVSVNIVVPVLVVANGIDYYEREHEKKTTHIQISVGAYNSFHICVTGQRAAELCWRSAGDEINAGVLQKPINTPVCARLRRTCGFLVLINSQRRQTFGAGAR